MKSGLHRLGVAGLITLAAYTGLGTVSAAGVEEPPVPPTDPNTCEAWAYQAGAGAYRLEAGLYYWKAFNCIFGEGQATRAITIRYYDNIDNDPTWGLTQKTYCMSPMTVMDVGVKTADNSPQHNTIHSKTATTVSGCNPDDNPTPPTPPPPTPPGESPPSGAPRVTVSGKLLSPINGIINRSNPSYESRPLAGARYKLMYFGRDGADTDERWRPVLSGHDANDRPSGTPVAGYLGADGSYSLTFTYPQRYHLLDGTVWEGCPMQEGAPAFMQSQACADSHLQLRVYAENQDRSVVVRDVLNPIDLPLPAHRVHLGRFFDREPGDEVEVANSEYAMAYRGVLNARTTWPGLPAYPAIEVQIDDDDGANVVTANKFRVNRAQAGSTSVEHETSHLVAHHAYGGWSPPHCEPHYFTIPCWEGKVPNLYNAWWEGLAHLLAVVSEHPNLDDPTLVVPSQQIVRNLEDCTTTDPTEPTCRDGAAVEGRVAAVLWDLIDTNIDFKPGWGLADDYTVPLAEVLDHIRASKPSMVDEFLLGYRSSHPGGGSRLQEVFFLNTLRMGQFVDADISKTVGTWSEQVGCEPCAGGSYLASVAGEHNTHRWNFSAGVQAMGDRTYEIWVRLPGARPKAGKLTEYRVRAADGTHTVVLDQNAVADGWLNLSERGFEFRIGGDNEVILVNGPDEPNASLSADALILAMKN